MLSRRLSKDLRLPDIWALGVILFVMLTFNQPFIPRKLPESTSDLKLTLLQAFNCMKSKTFKYPKDCDLSPQSMQLIENLFEFEPNSRQKCEQLLLHEWFTSDLREYSKRRPLPEYNEFSLIRI